MAIRIDYTAIAKRIKALRVAAGVKQKDMAKESYIPAPNLSAYENGQRDVTLMALGYYSWKFKRSLNYLVFGREFQQEPASEIEQPDTFIAAMKNMFTFAFDNPELQEFLRKWASASLGVEMTLSPREKTMIQNFRALSEEQRESLCETAQGLNTNKTTDSSHQTERGRDDKGLPGTTKAIISCECQKGHQWDVGIENIKQATVCPQCSKK